VPDQTRTRVRSANLEGGEALRLLLDHVRRGDLGPTGPAAAELDELIDSPRIPLEDRLDGSVGSVGDPPRYAEGLGPPPGRVPEEDSLDPAADYDPLSGQLLLLVVLGGDAHAGAPEDLGRGDRRRLDRDTAEVGRIGVGNRVVRGRWD
jgi:hypothetical protein